MHTREKGNEIESVVQDWLSAKGYAFIQHNYVQRIGEIDLIFSDPEGCIVFVEVRYRRSQRYGGPLASITWRKKKKLVRTANSWLQRHTSGDSRARIDVVAVSPSSSLTSTELSNETGTGEHFQDYYFQWIQNAIEE